MNRILTCSLISILLLGCEREVPTSEVTFSIHENSAANPSFSLEYTSDQSGGTTVGSNNDNYWTSGKVVLKQGQYISLKATCIEPTFDLVLYIYIDGGFWKTASISAPTSTITLSGEIPAS